MDKYEYKVRADEIKSLIGRGDYGQAAEIADTIDWRRVKSVMMLCMVSDLYKVNRRYEDAKNMLLLAYERRPNSRTICYTLCELCIKTGEFMQALKYYKEFVQVAPKDTGRYILQYKLYEAQEVSLEERIGVLEELKKRDYREKWAYELAYLYHRVGLGTRCVEECDELILWFGQGKYVVKAMELKMLHQPLTPTQQEIYDRRFAEAAPVNEPEIYEEQVQDGQPPVDDEESYDWSTGERGAGEDAEAPGYGEDGFNQEQPEELDIQVKTMDVGQYNTINLQAELAAGLQEVLGADGMAYAGGAEGLPAEAQEIEMPEEAADETSLAEEEIEDSEVFFGATGEIEDTLPELEEDSQGVPPEQYGDGQPERTQDQQLYEPEEAFEEPEIGETIEGQEDTMPPVAPEEGDGQEKLSQPTGDEGESLSRIQMPKEMAEVLSQEANGQISIVLPESVAIEKQITGQMKLEDILVEWERIKKENEAKCQEEVRKHVLNQTGPMFTEFDATVRDGLLEQLEKGESGQVSFREGEAEKIEELELEAQAYDEEGEETAPEYAEYGEGEELEPEYGEYVEAQELEPEELEPEAQAYDEEGEEVASEYEEYGEGEELEPEYGEYVEAQELEPGELEPEAQAYDEEGEEVAPEYEEYGEAEELEPEYIEYEETEELDPEYEEYGEAEELAPECMEYEETEELEPEYEEYGEAEELEPEYAEYADVEELDQEDPEYIEPEELAAEEYSELEETEALEGAAYHTETGETGEEAVEGDIEDNIVEEIQEEVEAAETEKPKSQADNGAKREKTEAASDKPMVERDQAKVRNLTREEKELFAPYIQNRRSREQLVKALDGISMAAYTGNLIITGEEGMDTLTLAKNMMREIRMIDSNFSGKVAKVSGQGLNDKDVSETLEQLVNGALIIQKASGMSGKTAATLHRQLQHERFGLIVVLEDTEKAMKKLFLGTPDLYGDFTARVDLEALSNDALVAFGRQYAREKEYSIDNLGVLALHTRIEELQTIDHVVTVMEVKQIMDEAMRRASRKTLGHFFDILLARRYDDEDMVILTEKDFVA